MFAVAQIEKINGKYIYDPELHNFEMLANRYKNYFENISVDELSAFLERFIKYGAIYKKHFTIDLEIEMENYTMKYNKYSELDGLTYKDLALSHLNEGHFEKAIENFEEMYYNNYFHYGNSSEQVKEAAIYLGWLYLKTGDIKRSVKFAIDAGVSEEAQAIETIGKSRWGVVCKQIPEVSGFLTQRFGEELYKTVFKDIAKG